MKQTLSVKKKFLPLTGVIIGLIVGAAASPFTDLALTLRLWSGALAGLSATGLFELAFKPSLRRTK
ncbi:hypothetical protein J2Z69_003641 [Paenibacillus shirakamiensis]|uniref:Holin n=1 Tax=Paenibacillus shirakamiensis TaxID=1265935 RepID=A0ABS4JN41_9BACL|nr:hypothetical protein [Paenibacillus shirakamiensis]